jgi:hypothetical protein
MQEINKFCFTKWDGRTDGTGFFYKIIQKLRKRKIFPFFSLLSFFFLDFGKDFKKVCPVRPICPILILKHWFLEYYIMGQTIYL